MATVREKDSNQPIKNECLLLLLLLLLLPLLLLQDQQSTACI